ncbi:PAS domain-containing protein [Pseudoxanthomonas sp. 10H]|uniref:PAS domain-containing protein n=1 Tax=Pseudoxanthomonas sp. 10H TaxID=3242729 RepID=UPI003556BA99
MADTVPMPPTGLEFLHGDALMARRIAAHDWSAHPLGPPAHWPAELKTTLSIMLGSRFAMCVGWGPELLLFYNDPYMRVLGAKEPAALGRPIPQVWSELWDDIRPLAETALSGTATWVEDMHLRMQRHGFPEDTWWTFTYTPVRDPHGRVLAMLNVTHETTRRVLTERRLASENERLARMFELSPTFMAMLRGPEHRFEFANASYRRVVGDRDVVGKTVSEALPDAAEQGWVGVLDAAYGSGEPFVASGAVFLERATPDGPVNERHLDFVYQPVRDADGRIDGIFVTGVDVTARARSESDLRRREGELQALNHDLERQVAEHAEERSLTWQVTPDMLGVLNRDGVLEKTNPAWQRALGWTSAELAARPARDLVHPDDLPAVMEARTRLHAGEPLLGFECRMRTPAGEYRTLSWVASPEGGKFYCSARDVTEINAATRALADSQAQLRSLFETSYQLQGRCALDGTLEDANRTALDAIDGELEDVVGRPVWDTPWFTATPGMPEWVRGAFMRVRAGEPVREEVTVQLPTGLRSFDLSLRPLYDAAGAISAVVPEALDITERRATEEALRQSQKLEAMGQLTGGVAHDFNNLLTPIMAALELAGDPHANPERRSRTLAVARQSAERAAMLVQRLLAFARRQPLQTAEVDVGVLVAGIGELLRSSFDPRIRIEAGVEPGLPHAHADGNQLEMALLNLGVNARDAMPDGGTLTVAARSAALATGEDASLPAGRYVVITVADTGLGMDAATRARAIEPFFTTKGPGKGTGLGLSMVHGLASQLGGRLRIDSSPGRGTTAELWLPAADRV